MQPWTSLRATLPGRSKWLRNARGTNEMGQGRRGKDWDDELCQGTQHEFTFFFFFLAIGT